MNSTLRVNTKIKCFTVIKSNDSRTSQILLIPDLFLELMILGLHSYPLIPDLFLELMILGLHSYPLIPDLFLELMILRLHSYPLIPDLFLELMILGLHSYPLIPDLFLELMILGLHSYPLIPDLFTEQSHSPQAEYSTHITKYAVSLCHPQFSTLFHYEPITAG